MNADSLQRFAAGDGLGTIRADTLNALVDSAKLVKRRLGTGQMGGRFVPNKRGPGSLEVWVRNDTGTTLAERAIVELVAPLVDAVGDPLGNQERPAFSAVAPTATDSVVAVLVDPLPSSGEGRAVLLGVAVVNLSITSSGDEYCGPTASNTTRLTTAATGPIRILWKESGTGNKLGLVLLQDNSTPLNSQNVDGTAVDVTTTDIRANQATGIEFTTTGGYQRLDINPVTLASTFTYDITVSVPTCISIILTKTYASTTLGGQSVLTDVTASVAWQTKTVSMLHGTTVGAAGACVAPPGCCPSGAVSLACGDGVTYTTLTFSNKTLDCTCLPATGGGYSVPGGGVLARWTTASCPGNVQWDLKCVDDVYLLYAGGVACTPVSAVAGSMVFDSPNLGANCGGAGGTVRCTITP